MARGTLFLQSLAWLFAACLANEVFDESMAQFIRKAKLTSAGRKFLGQAEAYQKAELPDSTPRKHHSSYDFIVVGAGSAGAVVASRLSEIAEATVLLIEAGGHEDLIMDIPLHALDYHLSDANWNFTTEASDKYCRGMKNNKCLVAKGKVMGGSSVLNFMIANRGHPSVYDDWSNMNNTGWSYAEVLPYFKKLENMTIPKFRKDTNLHGTCGPITVSYPPFHTDIAKSFVKAGKEVGYRVNYDYNGNTQNGFSLSQTNTKSGSRQSSNRAYLHTARNRPNLFVSMNSLVSRVLIGNDKRAYGVEFIKGNDNITVFANKEIILCAGAINTPQLLMLSGIGPKEHLKSLNITVIKDAPVGENLMDHLTYAGAMFTVEEKVSYTLNETFDPASKYFKDYVTNEGAGPLSMPSYLEAVGFLNVDDPFNTDLPPNIEFVFLSSSISSESVLKTLFSITDSTFDHAFKDIADKVAVNIMPILLSPLSRGKILLKNKDIKTYPRIIHNYLSEKEDVRVIAEGIRRAIQVSQSEALQKYGMKFHNVSLPECEGFKYDSDEYWGCAVSILTFMVWHPAGTCRMGPEGNPTSVVNPHLQVIGIKGLRVADTSITPTIPPAHTNIPTIMIGEKLSDMVKEHHGYCT